MACPATKKGPGAGRPVGGWRAGPGSCGPGSERHALRSVRLFGAEDREPMAGERVGAAVISEHAGHTGHSRGDARDKAENEDHDALRW